MTATVLVRPSAISKTKHFVPTGDARRRCATAVPSAPAGIRNGGVWAERDADAQHPDGHGPCWPAAGPAIVLVTVSEPITV